MRNPIYVPRGKAKEYGDYAINIYTGCPHRCFYCFAPNVLRRDREEFHSIVQPRDGILEATRKQLEREEISGKLIHLCFTCDPYPFGHDSLMTRNIIELLKEHGNHVQILTKGYGARDFDLLDGDDWYGITIDCGDDEAERHAAIREFGLEQAHRSGVKTWISFEPVLDADRALEYIKHLNGVADRIKIGKLNYYPSNIGWADFGKKAEALCQSLGIDYYIKESLRKEMEEKT